MKRPTTRNIVVGIGMALVLVGIVWACLSLTSPGQLEASGGTDGVKSLSLLKKPAKKTGQNRSGIFAGIVKRQKTAGSAQNNASSAETSATVENPAPVVTPVPMKMKSTGPNSAELPSPAEPFPLPGIPAEGPSLDELLTEPDPLPEAPAEDFSALPESGDESESQSDSDDELNSTDTSAELSFDLPGSVSPSDTSEDPIFLNAKPVPNGATSEDVAHLTGGGIPLPGDDPFSDTETVFNGLSPETASLSAGPSAKTADSPAPVSSEETVTPSALPIASVPSFSSGMSADGSKKLADRRMNSLQPALLKENDSLLENFAAGNGLTGSARPGDSTLEGPQKAEIVLTKELPPEIQIGCEAVFRIMVKNVGATDARNVTLRDAVPAGARFIGSEPPATPSDAGELVWPAFDMAPEEEKVFECRFIPESEGEIGSTASVSFAAVASGRTLVTRPMLKLAVNAPNESLIGEKVKFDIAISNPGSGTATGVTLLENVPDGLEHPSGRTLNNEIGDIRPGETKKLSLTLRTALPGVISNLMTVTADAGLKEEATTEIKVNAPELALEIVGAKNRYLEREAVYHLKVWNPGSAPAKGVKLVTELPRGVEFVRTNNEGVYQESTHAVYWELVELPENIAPGEIELVIKPTGAGSGKIVFRGEGENRLTASTEQDVMIDGIAALSYRMTALTDTVESGGEALFEIVLSNRGTKESTNVQLKVTLPEGMETVEADGPTRYSPQEDGLVFLPLAKVAPKEDVTYKLKTRCVRTGDLRLSAEVGSDDMEPLRKEESVRVYGN